MNVREIVGKVWPHILAGIAIGAVIHGWVPENFMARIMSKSAWWSVPLAVLIGVPMYSNVRWTRAAASTFFVLTLLVFIAAPSLPLPAKPPPGPDREDPPRSSVLGGGSNPGPSLPPERWTLGDDLLPFDGDPLSLDSKDLYRPELLATDPSVLADPSTATTGCGKITRTITPIKIGKSTPALPNAARYFSFRTRLQTLVGISADAGCHLELAPDKCNKDNYTTTIQSAFDAGLNKMRLWVALAGEKNPNNVPFLQVGSGANAYWNLRAPNPLFFGRLRDVVAFAQSKKMIVEVTFFAPFEGDFFSAGPWGGKGKLPNDHGRFEPVKFSKPEIFVTRDKRRTPEALTHKRMRVAQSKVIEWTVKELWCFDNVYWEIANEPEAQTVDPLDVAQWQRDMIALVTAEERKYRRLAAGGHLVAVQPSTVRGAGQFIGDRNVDILNGHYTTANDQAANHPPLALDLGALSLIQRLGNRAKLFGFNETKITPLGGKAGTRAHINGSLTERLAEPARAEAWEFLFDQGATYDHFGYLSGGDPDTPGTIRRQLGVLAKFVNALPLGRLSSSRAPAWVSLNPYPRGTTLDLDTARVAYRYWAALQTRLTDANRLFLLYLHHSTVRCAASADNNAAEADFLVTGCPRESNATNAPPIFLPRNSYDARIWTTQQYQDRLTLVNLGPAAAKFDIQWITPATGSMTVSQTIDWDPARETCNGGSCEIVSPLYAFDIVLRVQQQVTRRRSLSPGGPPEPLLGPTGLSGRQYFPVPAFPAPSSRPIRRKALSSLSRVPPRIPSQSIKPNGAASRPARMPAAIRSPLAR